MDEGITPEQREILLKLIENPPRGSALDSAKRWGVDLQALVHNLCLTPGERIRKMTRRVNLMLERARRKQLRKAAHKRKSAEPATCSSDEGRESS
jgi:hypothetical protein